MIRLDWVLLGLGGLVVLWHESAENPVIFCYRMCSGFFALFRKRSLDDGRRRKGSTGCSNPSGICCTPFTTSRA